MSLQLEFVGHACFRLWENGRPLIVTDPPTHKECKIDDDGSRLDAEIVIVSSLTDLAHSNTCLVRGQPRIINALDIAQGIKSDSINDEPVVAIGTAEAPDHTDHDPMDNAMYAFIAGGYWFAHVGDIGYGLQERELAPWIGKCDILMAIVGEMNTIALDDLDRMIDILSPTWIFPMHYGLPPLGGEDGGGMKPVDVFLNRRLNDSVLVVRHHSIAFPLLKSESGRPTIVVLEPSLYRPTKGLLEFQTKSFIP